MFPTPGGFVAGTRYVADHQILAGMGYIFSASLPPLLATAVITALDMIDSDPELVLRLQDNALEVHNSFQSIDGLVLHGDRYLSFVNKAMLFSLI